jgi:mannose-1-phosphate guanylyltransferase/phosphomannomutase
LKVVVMAGGGGTRLKPLTCNIPKPMVPIANKPIMEHIIGLVKKYGITDIAVTLQYMPELIKDYFGDGSDFGVNLNYYVEPSPLGTAGSVKNAEDFLDDTFVVISGDALTDIQIDEAIQFHKNNGALATLVLAKVDVPLEYGVVVTDERGKITRFLEKPSWGEVFSDTVNTGIYILEPEVLKMFNKEEVFDFSKDLFPMILKQEQPIYGYVTQRYWCDIGDLRAYHRAQMDILEKKVDVQIDGYKNNNQIWIGEGCQIDPDSFINSSVIIGKNVKIKKGVFIDSFSVIGDGTILDENSSVKRSIVWKNCYIGPRSEMRGTVLANNVQLKEGCSIFENSVIGSNVQVGEQSVVRSNVKIWPDKIVDYATQVNSNLVWENKCTKSVFGSRGISGQINLNITPEFASKVGVSFGSILNKKSKIAVSYNGVSSAFMLSSSVIAGLLSAGNKVYDFGKLLLPMTRTAIKFYGLDGGIHISAPLDKNDCLTIDFLDASGSNINRSLERKIENVFIREDFTRCDVNDISTVSNINDFSSFYVRNILNKVKFKNFNYKVLFSSDSELVEETLKNVLGELGCKAEKMNIAKVGQSISTDDLTYFANYVRLSRSEIGVIIDSTSEKMILVDEKGKIINEDMYLAIVALILFKNFNGCTAVVPISASNVMEALAHQYNGKILRTKTSIQEIMTGLNSTSNEEKDTEQFSFYFDAIESLAKIMDFMFTNKLKLSQLVELIPDFHVKKKEVECPWELKGKVIRSLAEDKSGEKVELLEGVKIYKDGGWVLILPDAEKPVCRIIGEGMNEEFAEELTDVYVEKIKQIEQENENGLEE